MEGKIKWHKKPGNKNSERITSATKRLYKISNSEHHLSLVEVWLLVTLEKAVSVEGQSSGDRFQWVKSEAECQQ